MTKEELYAIADQPIDFQIGKYMSEGFDIYKKNIGGFIGFLILGFIIYVGIGIIPIIGGIISPMVMLLLHAGALIVIRKLYHNENVQFNDFFDGFKFAGPIITFGIIMFLMLMAVMVPMMMMFFGSILSAGLLEASNLSTMDIELLKSMSWIMLLICVLILGIFISYIFSMNILLFINDNFWVAMEGSRKVVFKKFLPILGFVILLYIISVLSMVFTFGLAAFVVIPWMHASISAAFEDIYKPSQNNFDSKIDSFGSFQKDLNTEADEKFY